MPLTGRAVPRASERDSSSLRFILPTLSKWSRNTAAEAAVVVVVAEEAEEERVAAVVRVAAEAERAAARAEEAVEAREEKAERVVLAGPEGREELVVAAEFHAAGWGSHLRTRISRSRA